MASNGPTGTEPVDVPAGSRGGSGVSLLEGRVLNPPPAGHGAVTLELVRYPTNLGLHHRRLAESAASGDPGETYGALVDLFIATDPAQFAVRRRELDEHGSRLDEVRRSALEAAVDGGLEPRSALPPAPASLFWSGVTHGLALLSAEPDLPVPFEPVEAQPVEAEPVEAATSTGPDLGPRTDVLADAAAIQAPPSSAQPGFGDDRAGRRDRRRVAVLVAAAVLAIGAVAFGANRFSQDGTTETAQTTTPPTTAIQTTTTPQTTTTATTSTTATTATTSTTSTTLAPPITPGAEATTVAAVDSVLALLGDPAGGAPLDGFTASSPSAAQIRAVGSVLATNQSSVEPVGPVTTLTRVTGDDPTLPTTSRTVVELVASHQGLDLHTPQGDSRLSGPGNITFEAELERVDGVWQVQVLRPFADR